MFSFKNISLYSRLSPDDLQRLVISHQEEFDLLLGDNFSDEELIGFEAAIDEIGAVYAQPLLSELSFDDFYPQPGREFDQKNFFSSCNSVLIIENLPFLETNPFQITYLIDLLEKFDQVLIDRGGVTELLLKPEFLRDLYKFKSLESLLEKKVPVVQKNKLRVPVEPIDFLVRDVYLEIDRLLANLGESDFQDSLLLQSSPVQKLFKIMQKEKLNPEDIYLLSGLIPKDFSDHLEKLKLFLKKL
jgi:hypothetical protein